MMRWRLKKDVPVETLEKYGFLHRDKYYMRRLPTSPHYSVDFVYVGTEKAVFPGVVSLFVDTEDVAPHIKDLIDAELVEQVDDTLALLKHIGPEEVKQ